MAKVDVLQSIYRVKVEARRAIEDRLLQRVRFLSVDRICGISEVEASVHMVVQRASWVTAAKTKLQSLGLSVQTLEVEPAFLPYDFVFVLHLEHVAFNVHLHWLFYFGK